MTHIITEATKHQMDQTFSELNKNFQTGETRSYEWRRDTLQNFRRLLKAQEKQIENAMSSDLGLSQYNAYLTTNYVLISEINYTLKNLKNWMQKEKLDTPVTIFPSNLYKNYEPLGNILIISSWNYPFATLFSPFITAIAAGNVCVLKPSESAVECSRVIKDIVDRMDQRFFRCFEGKVETSVYLNKLPFDSIVFTGGTKTGTFIMKDASANLTKCTLELGGKNHCVVDSTANLDLTAKRIAHFKFFSCGQTCVAPDYLFVEKSVSEEFLKLLKQWMVKVYGENAVDSKNFGRIINERQAKFVNDLLEGQDDRIILSLGKTDLKNKFIPPTLVLNPLMEDKLMQEEIFGPILPIIEYTDFKKVIKQIKEMPKCLSLYYFGDLKSQNYYNLKNNTSSGSLVTNDIFCSYLAFTGGFGGVGMSGMGKIKGFEGFKDCSHSKIVIERSRSDLIDIPIRYGPKSENSLRQLKFLGDHAAHKTIEPFFRGGKFIGIMLFLSYSLYYLMNRGIITINL